MEADRAAAPPPDFSSLGPASRSPLRGLSGVLVRPSFRAVRDPQEPVSQPDSAAQKVEFPGSINSPKPVASQPLSLRLLRDARRRFRASNELQKQHPRDACALLLPPVQYPLSLLRFSVSRRARVAPEAPLSGCVVVTPQELPEATAMQCLKAKISGSPDGARCGLSSHWAEALFRVAGWVATPLPRRAPRAPMRVSRTLASSWCWPRAPRSSALFHPSSDPP